MSPARIVAVTRLALDVAADLDRARISGKGIAWGSAEGAFYAFLSRHQLELQAIHAAAMQEMQELAPRVLAEAYPAPG